MMDDGYHWISRKRLRMYPRLLLLTFAALGILWLLVPSYRPTPPGTPMGDFCVFWIVSRMAAAGHAADAYSMALYMKAQTAVFPHSEHAYAFYYPPTFFMLIRPLARLPFAVAFALFDLSTLALYVLTFRKVTRNETAMWCLAAFSGMWVNLMNGQNAFLTASLAAAAILSLQKRPKLAGVFVGLLCIKPHLALLFPVALVAAGAWSTILIAALTVVVFFAVSTAVMGPATLHAFIGSLAQAKVGLESGLLNLEKMPTVYGTLHLLGAPYRVAYAAHAVVAVAAAYSVWHIWRRTDDLRMRGAVLMTATFLISPYVFDYDLAWLAFPIAWFAFDGMERGWLQWEREVLVAAWLLPLFMPLIMEKIHVQVGAVVLMAMVWVLVNRVNAGEIVAVAREESEPHPSTRELDLLPAR